MIAYSLFPDEYPDNSCYSLLSCFVITIDQTFKNNGGIGPFLTPIYTYNTTTETSSYNIGRLFYDQLFNFMLVILIIQILAGIIIDKFGEIREGAEEMQEELNTKCIMCGETGETIERVTAKPFVEHKEDIHNLWNYLLFIGYLKRKPKRNFNGIEAYVYKCFQNNEIVWLPYSM